MSERQEASKLISNIPQVQLDTRKGATMDNKYMIKLSTWKKFAYGLGDLGCGFSNGLIASFFLLYCTDTFGVSAGVVGTIMLLGRFWDMINDTWVGAWSDRSDSPQGKYIPWVKRWTPVLFIITILTFWAHPDWSSTGKTVYVFVMYFAWAFAYTLVNVPYTALTPVLTQDPGERASLAGWRMGLSNLNMTLTGALTMPLVAMLGKGDNVSGWLKVTIIFSLIGCICLYVCAFASKEVVRKPASLEGEKTPILTNIKYAFRNKFFIIAAIGMFLFGFMNLGRMTVMSYFFLYVVGDMAKMSLFITVQGIGGIIGAFSAEPLVKHFRSKGKAVVVTSIGIIIFVALQYLTRGGGALFMVFAFCGQFCIMSALSAVFSTMADCVEYSLLQDGTRMDAFFGAFGYFWHKAGIALGSAGAGWMLSLTGYVPNAPEQAASVTAGIEFMFFLLPIILAVVSVIAFSRYKLDFDMFNDILKKIEEKYGPQGEAE